MKFKDPKFDFEVNKVYGAQAVTERQRWVERSKNLLNEVNDLVSAADKKLLTTDKQFIITNFAEEAEMLEWAGISFGEENTIKLGKSIKVSFKFLLKLLRAILLNFDFFLLRDLQS